MAHDVFVSFKSEDVQIAEYVVNLLTNKYGISCWIYSRDSEGGQYFRTEIPKRIDEAKLVCFIQSKNTIDANEIQSEINIAFEDRKLIIPFKIDDTPCADEYRYALTGRVYIDATKPTIEERIDDLAHVIYRSLGKTFGANATIHHEEKAEYNLLSSKIHASTNFYGREDILDLIHDKLSSDERVVFLKGMGGIGKSEIAKQYVKKYKNEYEKIVWLRYGGSLVELLTDDNQLSIEGLCRKTKSNNTLQTDDEYAKDKLAVLNQICSERTLIIVDNYDTTFDAYLAEFVSNGTYKILFTTRMEQERRKYCVIPINEIENDDDLKDLFIGYCNSEYMYVDRDDEAFSELFELTNRHTLTLELIAQYMEEVNVDLTEMVERLKQNGFKELSNAQLIRNNEEQFGFDYIRRIFHMVKLSSEEQQFLRYMSLVPKQGIAEQYFKVWCGDCYKCKTSLQKKSWIQYDAKNRIVSLHPIIYEVVNYELPVTFQNCNYFLNSYLETAEEERNWNASFATKQTMYVCCQNIINKIPLCNDETFELYYGMVHAYIFVANYDDGIKYLNQLYDYLRKNSKENTDVCGKVFFKIGWLHLWNGNFSDAKLWLKEKAYPVLKSNLNLNCANEYTHCIREIGSTYYRIYRNQDRNTEFLNKAEMYYREAFAEIERIVMNGVNDKLASLFEKRKNALYMNIGRVLIEKKDYDNAKEYLFRAKEWFDNQPNRDGDQSSIYYSLGDYFIAINDVQAVEYLKIAMEKSKNTLTKFSFSRMEKHRSLARAYEIIEDYFNAKESYKEMLEIARAILVPEHPIIEEVMKKINELTDKTVVK